MTVDVGEAPAESSLKRLACAHPGGKHGSGVWARFVPRDGAGEEWEPIPGGEGRSLEVSREGSFRTAHEDSVTLTPENSRYLSIESRKPGSTQMERKRVHRIVYSVFKSDDDHMASQADGEEEEEGTRFAEGRGGLGVPVTVIDHIHNNKADNRQVNLRRKTMRANAVASEAHRRAAGSYTRTGMQTVVTNVATKVVTKYASLKARPATLAIGVVKVSRHAKDGAEFVAPSTGDTCTIKFDIRRIDGENRAGSVTGRPPRGCPTSSPS